MNTPKVALADVAPNRRQGGSTRALLTPVSVGATSGFLGTIDLAPGEFVAEHYHPYSDKYLYLTRGTVLVVLNGEEIELRADEALLVTRGTRNRIVNTGDVPARAVFQISPLAPKPELGHVDTEPVPYPDAGPPRVGGL
ncbi:cupin domain-containing protein [Amycolatopsis rifamycinica]|uniref:Cupin n=1 Tax=Amycolatopsis rifamycinica TaxID=287986 RepID=A0A066U6E4_9PSEU|nr:cupin domain-containing protein [Amycolatopsis rifamycinica]KDN22650.1 cupin [Amycolatopsis rifamycinica]